MITHYLNAIESLKTPGVMPALMGGWFAIALTPAVIQAIFPPSK